jgi:hypothetical protein
MIKSGSGAVRTVPPRTRCDSARPTFYRARLKINTGLSFFNLEFNSSSLSLSLCDSPTEHSNFPTDLSVSVQGSRERVCWRTHTWIIDLLLTRPARNVCGIFWLAVKIESDTMCVRIFICDQSSAGCQNNKRDIFGLLFACQPYVFVLIPFDVAFLIC